MNVNDKTLKALASAIKFREMRQEIISSNVANSETPGYKAKRLDFESALPPLTDINFEQSEFAISMSALHPASDINH